MKKKIFLLAIVMCFTVIGFSQDDAISKYFEQYMDDEDFTVVYISGRMFSMFSDVDDEDKEAKEAMKGGSKEIKETQKVIDSLATLKAFLLEIKDNL